MKQIIIKSTTVLACLISFNGLFGAANGQESMEELNRRYQAAQALQGLFYGPQSSSSSSSSSTVSDDPGELKRTQREEQGDEAPERAPKHPRILEHPGALVTESDRIHQETSREQFMQAVTQNDPLKVLSELEQYTLYNGNPLDLLHTPEFNAFIHSEELDQFIKKSFATLVKNPGYLRVLQRFYELSSQNPELHEQINKYLQRVMLFMGQEGAATVITVNLAKNFELIKSMYELGLLRTPEMQDPLDPQKIELRDLSQNSLRLIAQFVKYDQHLQDILSTVSRRDTPEQRITKMDHAQQQKTKIAALFKNLNLKEIEALIRAATFLGMTQPYYYRFLNRILHSIRMGDGNFHRLDTLPVYMKKDLARASERINPIAPIRPPGPAIQAGCNAWQAYENSPEFRTWKRNIEVFLQEQNWRNANRQLSIFDLIMQNKIPAISTSTGHNTLNLAKLRIDNLEGLADIPGIETVEELNLAENFIRDVPADSFKALPNLKILNLSGALRPYSNDFVPQLRTIDDNAFRGLKKLETLNLAYNALRDFNLKLIMFNGLPSLKNLNAKGNYITHERRTVIKETIKLVTGNEPTIWW